MIGTKLAYIYMETSGTECAEKSSNRLIKQEGFNE
jgi:hypothetical protein